MELGPRNSLPRDIQGRDLSVGGLGQDPLTPLSQGRETEAQKHLPKRFLHPVLTGSVLSWGPESSLPYPLCYAGQHWQSEDQLGAFLPGDNAF